MALRRIGVVGAGMMGRGIAEVAAGHGLPVTLVKARPGGVEKTKQAVVQGLDRAVKRGALSPEARDRAVSLVTVTDDRAALAGADLVVESVVEDLHVKQALFADLERRVANDTVLATNTSSLRVGDVGGEMEHPERLIGLHFFSPVPAMKLVEVAPTRDTSPLVVDKARAFVEALGKTPVLVGDSSGYIVNRLLVPYLLDGIQALEQGVAGAQEIDTAMKLGCGHPMGPLALSDLIGLDVVYAMARTLYHHLHDRRYSPPPLLRRLVLAGELGRKSKIGIYDYHQPEPCPVNPRVYPVIEAGEEHPA